MKTINFLHVFAANDGINLINQYRKDNDKFLRSHHFGRLIFTITDAEVNLLIKHNIEFIYEPC